MSFETSPRMSFYILEHGDPEKVGRKNSPLSAAGIQQVQQQADTLAFELEAMSYIQIYSASDTVRAPQTAQVLYDRLKEVHPELKIKEEPSNLRMFDTTDGFVALDKIYQNDPRRSSPERAQQVEYWDEIEKIWKISSDEFMSEIGGRSSHQIGEDFRNNFISVLLSVYDLVKDEKIAYIIAGNKTLLLGLLALNPSGIGAVSIKHGSILKGEIYSDRCTITYNEQCFSFQNQESENNYNNEQVTIYETN